MLDCGGMNERHVVLNKLNMYRELHDCCWAVLVDELDASHSLVSIIKWKRAERAKIKLLDLIVVAASSFEAADICWEQAKSFRTHNIKTI